MGERVSIGLAVLYSVPFIASALLLTALIIVSTITGEPVIQLDGAH